MRVKQMYHPLCCLPLENTAIGNQSPEISTSGIAGSESSSSFAGVLSKWTNYSKGWRSRWFVLRHGVLSYSKTHRLENFATPPPESDVSLIGPVPSVNPTTTSRHKNTQSGIIHLKISSFRESRSDNRRFYIFTATKTLHLRTHSKKERVAWIRALVSTRCLYSLRPLNDNLSLVPSNLSLSTAKLKNCLLENGISEVLVKDCEQIMISEFSDIEGQVKVLCEERSNLLDTLRQLEAANFEAETSGATDGDYQLTKFEYSSSSLGRGKFAGYSTTESSDDAGKQELDEVSDEEEAQFFDTEECFPEATTSSGSIGVDYMAKSIDCQINNIGSASSKMDINASGYPPFRRRNKLPDPVEKEKGVSLWAMIKDMVGKDLSRVCLPVYFNEPISTLQKCFEELEYSHLLDQAYEYGKEGNSLLRILSVAAFAVSGYASTDGRHCKPFNPMLGETYEADYPEKGVRFFSEKVSHHPTLIACHCEGKGWKFWGDSNLRSKFWGRSIQLDPLGTLTLEFDDGEIFQWSKVTTTIYNLILGKLYCDHHGTMQICGNRQYSCTLKFKEQSILDRNPRQVHGFVEDDTGEKVATLYGKWDEHMYYTLGDRVSKTKDFSSASLLWKRSETPPNLTRYNLTPFAITLNEIAPGLKEKLPPTDSRLRPDQRHLENGEYDKANEEKQRLETRQRMSRKLQENGWRARWFNRESEDGPFRYAGGYWEAREKRKWDDCADIFGQFCEDLSSTKGS
ncbi:hypothetical protein DCAR_0209565 [Daucus carota subsp. sativus]|uniref:Uncharacterized protein n=2 Tax=Daucus carota subsp. sativus TaxID=79200 RepID=A0A166FCY0_DAUCS|nr:PREDICTED: oxysterol-binding protein-related protein 2A-like isoform X2 [Daucus carota subsp. sativus]WOG90322.1 hypothetical protein DCAR_0209565 [Daucus carota subsp. sativus]